MIDRGILKVSPIPVHTEKAWFEKWRDTPHKFLSLADTLSGLSGMALGRAIGRCYRCGEDRGLRNGEECISKTDQLRDG